MSIKKLSISDVAEQLNISKTTVSFVLNGRAKEKRISDKLSDRILNFVAESGYKPNMLAKSLRTGVTKLIGLIVEDMSNPFFSAIARHLEDRAHLLGYKVIYCSSYNDPEKTRDIIGMLRDRHIDGYIISPPEGADEVIGQMVADGIPLVLFDRIIPGLTSDNVVINNLFSTYNATQHLIAQGYKNILLLTFSSRQSQMSERSRGYKMGMKENGLKPLIKEFSYTKDAGAFLGPVTTYLAKNRSIDAIIFGTNYLGAVGLKAFAKLGIRIPEDIAVVAFDDSDVFDLHKPAISAIAQPVEEIADRAFNLLIEKLENGTQRINPLMEILHTDLIIRESSRKKTVS